MSTWAYNLDHEKLVHELWAATVRAGISGSGLMIDLSGSDDHHQAFYLQGVVLSRLEGKQPPFQPGDKVCMSPDATYYCGSVNWIQSSHSAAEPGVEYEVSRIYYEKYREYTYQLVQNVWTISFRGKKEDYRFPADRFRKIEQVQPAAA